MKVVTITHIKPPNSNLFSAFTRDVLKVLYIVVTHHFQEEFHVDVYTTDYLYLISTKNYLLYFSIQ